MADPAFTYEVETETASGHYFDSAMKMHSYSGHHRSRIKRSDGVVVWRSQTAFRRREASRREANESRRRLEAYLARHGRCWYDVRQETTAAKKARKEAMQAFRSAVANAAWAGMQAVINGEGQFSDPNPHPLQTAEHTAFRLGYDWALDHLPPLPELQA
jgi:hypothetical protein